MSADGYLVTADGDWWGVTVRAEIGGTDDPVFDATVAPEGAPATLIAVAVATALLSFDEAAR